MESDLHAIPARFRAVAPACDYWTLRVVATREERLAVRQGVPEPVARSRALGAMVTVEVDGGIGYGATSDLSGSGLRRAAGEAVAWARLAARLPLPGAERLTRLATSGDYASPVEDPWDAVSAADKLAWLAATAPRLRAGEQIVDWFAALYHRDQQVLLADGAGPGLIQRGEVDLVVVGADRIARNGDFANKVGTYPLALACAAAGVPFYCAAPLSTFDRNLASGAQIPIEERAPEEVTHLHGRWITPAGVTARNPAFDVTPHALVTGIVTDLGVLRPPYEAQIATTVADDLAR